MIAIYFARKTELFMKINKNTDIKLLFAYQKIYLNISYIIK